MGAYALVGMGAAFAGIVRVPLTSVIMIFEITRDYSIVVPLMIANLISYFIASRFQKVPIYEALQHQDGIHLPAGGARAGSAAEGGERVSSRNPPRFQPRRVSPPRQLPSIRNAPPGPWWTRAASAVCLPGIGLRAAAAAGDHGGDWRTGSGAGPAFHSETPAIFRTCTRTTRSTWPCAGWRKSRLEVLPVVSRLQTCGS